MPPFPIRRTPAKDRKHVKKLLARDNAKRKRLAVLGIDYDFTGFSASLKDRQVAEGPVQTVVESNSKEKVKHFLCQVLYTLQVPPVLLCQLCSFVFWASAWLVFKRRWHWSLHQSCRVWCCVEQEMGYSWAYGLIDACVM